jgi:hypothetical protein
MKGHALLGDEWLREKLVKKKVRVCLVTYTNWFVNGMVQVRW